MGAFYIYSGRELQEKKEWLHTRSVHGSWQRVLYVCTISSIHSRCSTAFVAVDSSSTRGHDVVRGAGEGGGVRYTIAGSRVDRPRPG